MNTPNFEFVPAPKTPRLSREIVVTEKIDGTRAAIIIDDSGELFCASRTRWITPMEDNYGFARWAEGNREELLKLGPGRHEGEWWGQGIQRTYGEKSKHFSLFNTARWTEATSPLCCRVVPVLYQGEFNTNIVEGLVLQLRANGSVAAPGFLDPEGVVVFHSASGQLFKKTVKDDEKRKSQV